MSRTHRGSTIFASVVILVLGVFVGVRLLTATADTFDEASTCENRTIDKGAKLTSNLVSVNVYNASQRSGLANRVAINLQRRGFLSGTVANSTSEVKPGTAAILTDDRDDPRVKLVAEQFAGVEFAEPDINVPEGVTVIVGDDYQDLAAGAPREVESDRPVTVCVPAVDVP
jgi:hypothetical protein